MEDTLYTALKYIAPRRVRYLPFGAHIAFDRAIYYHFYHVPDDAGDAAMRLASAAHRLEQRALIKFKDEDASRIIDALLLGFVAKPAQARQILKDGRESEVIEDALKQGCLSPSVRLAFERDDFPFKQSPLVGKTIVEIAKSSVATTVFVIAVSGENAPIAIILTPVGIVAIHVANRIKGQIAKKVDDMLRDLLK